MKILVILSRVPYPLEKGDKLRAFHQIRCLAANHDVHLFCLNDTILDPPALPVLENICKSVTIIQLTKPGIAWNLFKSLFTGKPYQVGYFYSCEAKRAINRLVEKISPDHIYCQLIRTAEYVLDKNIPKTIDYQDVFSKGMERRARLARFPKSLLMKTEYRRLLRYENMVFEKFNNKTIISQPDKELIPHPRKNEIFVIPNGVDAGFFNTKPKEKKWDLLFTGNMGYAPNINSAEYLVKEIMPLVWKKHPETRLLLAGANPHRHVLQLASPRINVAGWVEDIRDCYASARIFIAPMQIGTGLQNKLLEAMAMGLPCITSNLANNALGAEPGTAILIGENPEQYASHIIALMENEEKALKLATNGCDFVKKEFVWEVTTSRLEAIILNTK